MVQLRDERDLETLRQISLLLDKENQRLIDKVQRLTLELARLRGITDTGQLELALLHELQQAREAVFRYNERQPHAGRPAEDDPTASRETPRQTGHGPRPQPALPMVDVRHELPPEQRTCDHCGGQLREMPGQYEESDRVTTVKLTYQIEHHRRQKYRCRCNANVVTAPAPPQVIPGGRYSPEFAVGVAIAKYADHLPLERQVRMMAREGLDVDSQTLWDQLNALARHLAPTYDALGARALQWPVINVDETRWPMLGSDRVAAGTVWGLSTPTVAFYRMLPGKSATEGEQMLGGYRGIAVVDGFAVYETLARASPTLTLAHCWAHTKRKYDEIAEHFPSVCADVLDLIGQLYGIERLVPGPFPGGVAEQQLRARLRQERSKPILDQIWQWATLQAGLPRSDFGKAVRYMLQRWEGLTRFVGDPRIPLDNNAAERALRGPVVGRKNHYGSRSPRGTQVAALFYTLCETAKLVGVDPHAYMLQALYAAIARPGAVTFPEAFLASELTA